MDSIATEVGWYVITFVVIIVVCWLIDRILGSNNERKQ